MILMTDCSSLDEMLPKEHNADAYGRWYGEEVAFVGDCSENKINFDELTCMGRKGRAAKNSVLTSGEKQLKC